MPSPFTSSFASAAAGNHHDSNPTSTRGMGSGDWSRARTNGNTTTFRRASGANNLSQRIEATESPLTQSGAASSYVPPHVSVNHNSFNRNGNTIDMRYSKEQLLDLFNSQQDLLNHQTVDELFIDGWNPKASHGTNGGGWGRSDERKDIHGPEVCWDQDGNVHPLGLIPLTSDEEELFNTSVNSPIKLAAPNKDGTPNTPGVNRRTSLSHGQGPNSTQGRPNGRQRRDSGDVLNNVLTSPTSSSRYSKDESSVASPPPSLLRRRTDFKDNVGNKLEDQERDDGRSGLDTASPIGSLKRTATNPLSAGFNGPSSPWSSGPASAGFTPMGAFGNFAGPQSATDRKPGFGRSESRFKSLMGGTSSEDMKKTRDPVLQRNISESLDDAVRSPWETDTAGQRKALGDLYEDDIQRPAGSAALGGDDASPPPLHSPRSRNAESRSYDDIGFSSMSGGADLGFPDFAQRSRNISQHQGSFNPQQQGSAHFAEPLSPTYTNPYQSPEAEKAIPSDFDADDINRLSHQANIPIGGGFPSQLDHTADRSQTSSTGPSRGLPSLSGLGGLGSIGGPPRSNAPGAVGTPSKAYGDSPFHSFGDIGPPSNAGFGGSGFFGPAGSSMNAVPGVGGRGSKFAPFLPGNITDQSRKDTQKHDFGSQDDLASQANRVRKDELLSGSKDDRTLSQPASGFPGSENSQPQPTPSLQAPFSGTAKPNNTFGGSQDQDGPSNQLPHAQQRQMVMPDRMRWIYRDPQGNQQGPWSGLEMHDWYKAGFFSPELQIKKMEDSDYEPLAQLIRRIGNSREPFLVPQIGIPHGQPVGQSNQPAAAQVGSSSAQPPFASSFPSFGTTLTAEQQNALERRKQEEQYLMARQKEHLVAMQPAMHRMQSNMHNQQLHHHSSVHSLHSQPSYGSITSPGGFQAAAAAGPIQPPAAGSGFYDGMPRHPGPLGSENVPGSIREEDLPGFMERMNLARGNQTQYPGVPSGQDQYHQQQVNSILQEKARMQLEQQQLENVQRSADENRASAERLEEFQRLRMQESEQQRISQQDFAMGGISDVKEPPQSRIRDDKPHEQLSLSEQVQKTKNEAIMPQPFPPVKSTSPMPAPTPQRNRQSVAEALNVESQSQSPQPDSADTPSATMAPWAKEAAEAAKGPSLKEIQAIEARKAAQQEEIAAAARRAAAEQERLAQQSQPSTAPAPGLPSTSNWASSVSPAVPAASPWSKPGAGKAAVATPTPANKKTLTQIQKEEEARKNRAAASAAAATIPAAPGLGGKRYADLASKSANPTAPAQNAAWTTVGAGGKVKTPVAPAQPTAARSVSSGIVPAVKPKPSASTTPKASSNQQAAQDEFQKWIRNALGKGLNAGITVDEFISSLFFLPPEVDIISDSIYASSATLDGRRFAEEFVRRRKLADRGVVSDSATGSYATGSAGENKTTGNGGWSEVAKKGGASGGGGGTAKESEASREFKVVAGKKKGKR